MTFYLSLQDSKKIPLEALSKMGTIQEISVEDLDNGIVRVYDAKNQFEIYYQVVQKTLQEVSEVFKQVNSTEEERISSMNHLITAILERSKKEELRMDLPKEAPVDTFKSAADKMRFATFKCISRIPEKDRYVVFDQFSHPNEESKTKP